MNGSDPGKERISMGNAIELEGLTKRYKSFTLDHISLTLPAGCILGFIGENGAGKSTTIKAMLGLIRPDSGTIRLLGKEPQKDRSVMEEVGVVLDSGFFPPGMTARQVGNMLRELYKKWDSQKYRELTERFELPEKTRVKDYSRGMTMKLSLAAALSHRPRLLILDEATSGLDPIVRDDILDLLLEYIQDDKNSVFLSSHITGDLEKISDYVVFIHQGKIALSGEKDLLLDRYGLLKCGKEQLSQLDPRAIMGLRRNEFGVSALVEKYRLPSGLLVEPATLDDIMLYTVKGERPGKEGN